MKKLIIVLLAISLFSSCMVGPKYSRPAMQAPGAFTESNNAIVERDSILNLKWFDLFQDPVLRAVIDTTLRRNFDLRAAMLRVEQATEAYGISKAQLLPAFSVSGSGSQNSNGNALYSLNTAMSWELDLWGRIRHAKRAAFNELMATNEARKAVHSVLVATTAAAYFELRDFDNRLVIARETRLSREQAYALQQERFAKGYISEWDVLQSKQLLEDAIASEASFRRAIALTEHYLSELASSPSMRIPRGSDNKTQSLPPVMPAGLPSTLLEQRPDVKRAEFLYMSEVERIGVAQAGRLPVVSLSGVAGFANPALSGLFSNDAFSASLTEGLLGPIFAFGQNKRRVSLQQKEAETAALNYQQTFIRSIREVEDALSSVATYTDELSARERQTDAAAKVVNLSQARYDSGMTSYLELLDAQRTLFSSQLLLSSTRRQLLVSYIDLYRALGGGW